MGDDIKSWHIVMSTHLIDQRLKSYDHNTESVIGGDGTMQLPHQPCRKQRLLPISPSLLCAESATTPRVSPFPRLIYPLLVTETETERRDQEGKSVCGIRWRAS